MAGANRGRHEIRVLDACEVSPQTVGFPGVQTIARLQRRIRRKGKKTTGTVNLISRHPLEELDAQGLLRLKRGCRVKKCVPVNPGLAD